MNIRKTIKDYTGESHLTDNPATLPESSSPVKNEDTAGNGSTVESGNSNVGDPDIMSAENIKYSGSLAQDGKFLVLFRNDNSMKVPDLNATIIFYDADGNMVGTDSDGHDAVLPGASVASIFDMPDDTRKYEVLVTVDDKYGDYENLSEYVSLEADMTSKEIIVKATNTSSKAIDELEMVAVFFKDTYVIAADTEETYRIAPGQTVVLEFSVPYSWTENGYERLTFDDYSLYINQAHNFGS